MENIDKLNAIEPLEDSAMEDAAGGRNNNIQYVVCCTCGGRVHINGPMINGYYNGNVCPLCHGRLKSW